MAAMLTSIVTYIVNIFQDFLCLFVFRCHLNAFLLYRKKPFHFRESRFQSVYFGLLGSVFSQIQH